MSTINVKYSMIITYTYYCLRIAGRLIKRAIPKIMQLLSYHNDFFEVFYELSLSLSMLYLA